MKEEKIPCNGNMRVSTYFKGGILEDLELGKVDEVVWMNFGLGG